MLDVDYICLNDQHFISLCNEFIVMSYLGDEVLEWNGRSLQGATSDEVCEVLLESKQEPEVELIIKRPFHPYVAFIFSKSQHAKLE